MKQKHHSTPKTQAGFNVDQFKRHYVSAVDTDQISPWSETETTGYLGRVFIFLLLLHVFLIGAVVIYNFVGDKPKNESGVKQLLTMKADDSKKDVAQTTKSKPKDSIKLTAPIKSVEMDEYQVRSGDSLKSIADSTGVKSEDIIRINQLDTNGELYVGRKLLVPKKKIVEDTPKAIPVQTPVQQIAAIAPAKVDTHVADAQKIIEPVKTQELAPKLVVKPKLVELSKTQLDQPISSPVVVRTQDVDKNAALLNKPKEIKTAVSDPNKTKPVVEKSLVSVAENPPPAIVKPASPKEDKLSNPKTNSTKLAGSTDGVHSVKIGETFYSIAHKYGVGINELMKLNKYTNAGSLRDGVKLKIPSKN